MKHQSRSKTTLAVTGALTGTLTFGSTYVYSQAIEEMIVTATRRVEPMQDIPVAMTALDSGALRDFRIETFDDYLRFLPNVTQMGTGPGQSEIFIRGATSEQSIMSISSVQGSAPQVAMYQDEQPVSFGGRNLDVYVTDLERIEVLPGPQGTLFGASSQAGTVRLITAKPRQGIFEAGFTTGISTTRGGDTSNSIEAYINLPLTDRLAMRVAAYNDNQGGWIDNIQNDPENGGFRTSPEVLERNSIFLGEIADDAQLAEADNTAFVEDDFNTATYRGARFGFAYDVNPDWEILVQHTQQALETQGVFAYDPQLDGDRSVNRFKGDENKDDFGLTNWTVTGRIGMLDVIYTGGFLNREVETTIDYTGYTNGGGYQVYYMCAAPYTDSPACFDPTKVYKEDMENTRITNQIRFTTPEENRWGLLGGIFLDRERTESVGAFELAAPSLADGQGGVLEGSGAFQNELGMIGNDVDGANAGGERFGPAISFVNDFSRKTDQLAIFGEFKFDILENVTASVSARWYDIDFDFKGSTNSSFGCKFPLEEDSDFARVNPDGSCDGFGFNNDVTARLAALGGGAEAIEASGIFSEAEQEIILGPDFALGGLGSDGVLNESDVILRASLDWKVTDDVMLFATFSQGFRPPVTNRNAGRAANNPRGLAVFEDYAVPAIAVTDDLDNFELGIKSRWLDGTLQINATGYYSEIENLQTSRFDPSNVAFLVFIENVGDAEILGLDADFQWLVTPNLTIGGAFSLIDTEITDLNPQLQDIAVPVGSELPFTPTFSGNLRGTYDFNLPVMGGTDAYFTAGVSYTGESRSGIVGSARFVEDTAEQVFGRGSGLKIKNEGGSFFSGGQEWESARYVQRSYTLVDLAFGVRLEDWHAEVFVDNVTDQSAEMNIDVLEFTPRVVTNRPRTFGFRLSYDFGGF